MTEDKSRIFMLAWAFPPIASGESVVCARFVKYSRLNYDVCSGFTGNQKYEQQLPNAKVYPVRGRYFLWSFRAAMLFKNLDKKYNYKIMISRVMPAAGHFAGLLVKCLKPRIKWVVYFSDPIWNSPFISFKSMFINDKTHRPNYLLMKIFGIPAKIAISLGDMLVFNNERLARFILGKKYDKLKKKVIIAPYGHDGVNPETWPGTGKENNNRFVLSHVGQIYGNRTFSILIDALKMLKEECPELYDKIEILQVGFVCEAEIERIKKSYVADRFRLMDTVDYNKSLKLMRQSDCLLIIDPVFKKPGCNIYVPAKIFDYMSTGKPILAIADKDSATADIVQSIDGMLVPHDAGALCNVLKNLLAGVTIMPNLKKYEMMNSSFKAVVLDEELLKL